MWNVHLKKRKKNGLTLDACPIVAGGIDPFVEIRKTQECLSDSETLFIINTFEMLSLLNILKKRGYSFETQSPEIG
jgi:hypothetical protein